MSSLGHSTYQSDEDEISGDDSAWEDYDSSEDDESLGEGALLDQDGSSDETELSDDNLSDSELSDFSEERYEFPEDPFRRPGSPCYASAPKKWPPKFLKDDLVFFHIKNKKPKDAIWYRVADVNKKTKTYQLKKCFRPTNGRDCPLLYEEEDKRQEKRDREIRRLPGRQQQAEFEEEESIHKKWVAEYQIMLEKDREQPLHENGCYFAEKLLCRWY